MNYLSVAEFAEKNGVSDRYIRRLCAAGKLEAQRSGRAYRIPESAELPADRRHLRGKVVAEHLAPLFAAIDEQKAELKKRRPLTPGEVERLRDEFMVNYTYNSNATGARFASPAPAAFMRSMTISSRAATPPPMPTASGRYTPSTPKPARKWNPCWNN